MRAAILALLVASVTSSVASSVASSLAAPAFAEEPVGLSDNTFLVFAEYRPLLEIGYGTTTVTVDPAQCPSMSRFFAGVAVSLEAPLRSCRKPTWSRATTSLRKWS